jgi:ribosomal protein L32
MSNCQNCGKLRENYPGNTNNYYFDNTQKVVYSQNAQPYHAAPFPMRRTQYDLNMLQAFCANCGPGFCPSSVQYQPTEPPHSWNNPGGADYNSLNNMIMSDTHTKQIQPPRRTNNQPSFPMVPY